LADKKAVELIKKNEGVFHLKSGESRLNTYLDEIEDFKTHFLIFQQTQLTDYYQSPFEKSIFKVINLSKNGFAQFPLPLLLCKNLEELDLSYNKMKTLPKEICQLTKLSKLTLTGNELTELPEGIGILSKLNYFAVDRNNLTEIPSGLCYLKQLQTLCLENNNPFVRKRIMKIPTVVFNEACRSDSLPSQQDKLEKQLGLFFNMEALKEEQKSWVSSSPLGTLYERIIISEKQRTLLFANQGKEEDLKEYVKALSIEDLHLFYEMIFVCSTLWHQSISDKPFPIIKKVENRIQIGKNIFAKGVTEQILHQAVAEAIIKKYKNLDKNERSEVEERIRIAAKAPNTNDPNQDKELALSNLPRLAEVMDSQHSFCVIS
jgi:Leucine-rich repeat (LRR) protein